MVRPKKKSFGERELMGSTERRITTLTAGSYDNLSAEGELYKADTSGGTITISGFTGGKSGQRLEIIKTETKNKLIVLNNSNKSDQPILVTRNVDGSITRYGTVSLDCCEGKWYTNMP